MFRGDPAEGRFTLAAREHGSADQRTWNAKYRAAAARRDVALMIPTSDFEAHANGMTLIDMMAVSGAAVSPAMGRMSRPSIRLLLGVADVRLGMWLPNPLRHHRLRYAPTVGRNATQRMLHRFWWQLRQPGLGALAREICGGLDFQGNWIYVTDGGHYENLGLTEALRRGATEIVVFDATGDTPFSLATFGQAVETARADLGVEIALVDRGRLGPGGTKGHAKALAAVATATYANGVVATIYLCKAAVVDDLPPDVLAWAHAHARSQRHDGQPVLRRPRVRGVPPAGLRRRRRARAVARSRLEATAPAPGTGTHERRVVPQLQRRPGPESARRG
jgi:hypothetical protein